MDSGYICIMLVDLVGYSRFKMSDVQALVLDLRENIAEWIKQYDESIMEVASWGDALVFFSSYPDKLAQMSLEIREIILSKNLLCRIFLHSGQADLVMDPVSKKETFIGPAVARASRIERIVPPGDIFASENFVELYSASVEKMPGMHDIAYDDFGLVPIKKDLGQTHIYRIKSRYEPTALIKLVDAEKEYESMTFLASEDWSAGEVYQFFQYVNILYNRIYVIEKTTQKSTKRDLGNLLNSSLARVPDKYQLKIKSMEMHSPAQINLEGLGDVVGQVRGIVKDVSYRNKLEKQKMQDELEYNREKRKFDLANSHMDLLERQIKVLKQAGYSDEEIKENISKLLQPADKLADIMAQKEVSLISNG